MLGRNFSLRTAHKCFTETQANRQLAQSRETWKIFQNSVQGHIQVNKLK